MSLSKNEQKSLQNIPINFQKKPIKFFVHFYLIPYLCFCSYYNFFIPWTTATILNNPCVYPVIIQYIASIPCNGYSSPWSIPFDFILVWRHSFFICLADICSIAECLADICSIVECGVNDNIVPLWKFMVRAAVQLSIPRLVRLTQQFSKKIFDCFWCSNNIWLENFRQIVHNWKWFYWKIFTL